MSATATPTAKNHPSWPQFWASHDRRAFTPAFNSFLDSLIQDTPLLLLRIVAWLLRRSWGNHMDSPVSPEGIALTQTDCARELKLFTSNGEPDRRKVNPIFRLLEERNYIRFEGQSIDYKAYRAEMSETVPTNGALRPRRERQKVTNGSDNSSATEPTIAGASLLTKPSEPLSGASSSVSTKPAAASKPTTTRNPSPAEKVIAEAISQEGLLGDDALARQMLRMCREADPECSCEEIVHFVRLKAKAARQKENPTGFLCVAVKNCFLSHEMREYRRRQAGAQAQGAGQR